MKIAILAFGLAFFSIGAARADAPPPPIVCTVNNSTDQLRVTIYGRDVKVEAVGLPHPDYYRDVSWLYDGHATTLITAPGLAIRFENAYGCIRNANVTVNVRDPIQVGLIESIDIEVCTGGQTPDDLCLGHHAD